MRVILSVLLLLSSGAYALGQDDTRSAELASYDKKLNQTYQAILRDLSPEQQVQLKEAQRAWLKMRDADCSWAFVDNRDCLIDRTINRTKELQSSMFTTKAGAYISISDASGKH